MDERSVICCPAPLRREALRCLHAASDSTQQESLAQAIAAADAEGDAAWAGLFIDAEPPQSAVWVQRTAGNTAIVWPPEARAAASSALFRAAAAFIDERRITLAQVIVSEHDGFQPRNMAACGFELLANLLYLYADLAPLPATHSPPTQSSQFLSHAGDDGAELVALIEQTYIGTLDCPGLDGVRSIDDVLAGYRAQGSHLPQHWYRVTDNTPQRRPIGVLILASHPAVRNWELVYMGVIPAARGQGLGRQIVQFALESAARNGAERLVLAVDAANQPALGMYRRSGFTEWDGRTVYARLAPEQARVSSV